MDVTKFVPPLRGIPLYDSRSISSQLSQIKAEKLVTSTSKQDDRRVFKFDPLKVILDTGTTESYLPKELLQAIVEAYGGKEIHGSYYIPSEAATDTNVLRFTLNDVSIDVPLAEFVSVQKEKPITGAAVLPRWDDEKSWSDKNVKSYDPSKSEPGWQDAPQQCAKCSKEASSKGDGTDKAPSRSESDDKSPDGSADMPHWEDQPAVGEPTKVKDRNDKSIQVDVHVHYDFNELKHIEDVFSKHTKPASWTDIVAKRDVSDTVSDTKDWVDAADAEHWSDTSKNSVVDEWSDVKHWPDAKDWSDSTTKAAVESWSDTEEEPIETQEHWSDAKVVEYQSNDSVSKDWSEGLPKWTDEDGMNEKSADQNDWSDSDSDKGWDDAVTEWKDVGKDETQSESWSDEVQDNAEWDDSLTDFDYNEDMTADDKSDAEHQWSDVSSKEDDHENDAEHHWSDTYSEQVAVEKTEVDKEKSWTDVVTEKADWADLDEQHDAGKVGIDVDEEPEQDDSWTDKYGKPSSGKDVKSSKPTILHDKPDGEPIWSDVYAKDEPEEKSYDSEEVWSDVPVEDPYSEGKSQNDDWSKSEGSEEKPEEHAWADADYHSSVEYYADNHVWSDEHDDDWSDAPDYDYHDKVSKPSHDVKPSHDRKAPQLVKAPNTIKGSSDHTVVESNAHAVNEDAALADPRLAGAESEQTWYRLMARPAEDQYILGANFLRHAYMFVDFESQRVYLGQAHSSSSKDVRGVPFQNAADEQMYLSPPLGVSTPQKSVQQFGDRFPLGWNPIAPNKAANIDVTTVFENTDVTLSTGEPSRPTNAEDTVTVSVHKTRVTSAVVYEGGVPIETHTTFSGGSIGSVQVGVLSVVATGLLVAAMLV